MIESKIWLKKSVQPMIHEMLISIAVRAFEKKHDKKKVKATCRFANKK